MRLIIELAMRHRKIQVDPKRSGRWNIAFLLKGL